LEDLSAEESDEEFEKTLDMPIKFLRPPKTSKEALNTLKEVDARFEVSRKFLTGSQGSLLNKKKNLDDQRGELLK
jgi:hypothetical protein